MRLSLNKTATILQLAARFLRKQAVGTITVPQSLIVKWARPVLAELEDLIEDYEEELLEEHGVANLSEIDEDDIDLSAIESRMMDLLYEDDGMSFGYLKDLTLKNEEATKIIQRMPLVYTRSTDAKGRLVPTSANTAEIVLYPAALLLEALDMSDDFDDLRLHYKNEVYDTLRHEVIHAIHFAYEHAALDPGNVVSPETPDDDGGDDDEGFFLDNFDDYDQTVDDYGEEGVGQKDYEQLRYQKKRVVQDLKGLSREVEQVKKMPWDFNNLKLNPKTNYHNNRFELETWPSNTAAEAFRTVESRLPSDKSARAEALQALSEDLPKLRDIVVEHSSRMRVGPTRIWSELNAKNKKVFLTKTLKQLQFLVTDQLSDLLQ